MDPTCDWLVSAAGGFRKTSCSMPNWPTGVMIDALALQDSCLRLIAHSMGTNSGLYVTDGVSSGSQAKRKGTMMDRSAIFHSGFMLPPHATRRRRGSMFT